MLTSASARGSRRAWTKFGWAPRPPLGLHSFDDLERGAPPMTNHKQAADIRAELGHPVIDNDGHILENPLVLSEFVREVGGPKMVERYEKSLGLSRMSTWGK